MPWQEASIVSQRLEFVVLASVEGANVRRLCRRFRISAPTGYKWIERYRAGGEAALADRSCRPTSSPERSDDKTESAVLRLREQHPAWGARKLRAVLEARDEKMPAVSTVHAILRRHGKIDPSAAAKHQPWQRFEHDRPNALWQMDFKGHVPMQRGGRCHPLTIVDDHSRFSIGLFACVNEQLGTVQDRLRRVFRCYGLPERMLTVNGPPWAVSHTPGGYTRLSVWLMRLGVSVSKGRPFHPQTQGKAERFHRTLKAELLGRTDLRDVDHAQAALDQWRGTYNLLRPHEALGMSVPASKYSPSPRTFPETLPELAYGPDDQVRHVRQRSEIRHGGQVWWIGDAFKGEWVGVRGTADDAVSELRLGHVLIGYLNRRTLRSDRRACPQLAPLAAGRLAPSEVHV